MAIKEDILFQAKFDAALKDVSKFTKDASKSIQGLTKGFSGLGLIAKGAVAFLAGRQLLNGLKSVVKEAANQEQAVQNLNTALALTGDFTRRASRDMQAFASQLQNTSKFGDDVILNQIAIAKSFGVTNDRAKDLVTAAVELSSATGIGLESAVKNLGKTFSGLTGELGESLPALRELDKEALKTGAAIDLVLNRFGGASAASINTFDGSITQLSNTFGDLLEELGFFITKNPAVVASIKAITDTLKTLGGAIAQDRSGLVESFSKGFIEGLDRIIEFIPTFAQIVNVTLVGVINSAKIALNGFSGAVDALGLAFATLQRLVLATQFGFAKLFKGADVAEEIRKEWELATDVQQQFIDSLSATGKENEELGKGIAESFDAKIPEPLQKALDQLRVKLKNIRTDVKSIDAEKIFEDLSDKVVKPLTIETGFFLAVDSIVSTLSISNVSNAFSGVTASLSASFTSFKEGVVSLKEIKLEELGPAIAVAGQALFDGLNTVSQGLASVFSGQAIVALGEGVSKIGGAPAAFLSAFENLDGIIANLVQNFPKVFKKLSEEAPKIIKSIIRAIPQLIENFIKGLSKIADLIADAAPKLAGAILDGLTKFIDAVPAIVDKLAQALPGLFRVILQKLPALISAILRAIPKIVSSLAKAIPELVIVFLEELPAIVLALVEGILTAIPQIVFALIDAFIVKGGIFRIVGALILATPKIAVAIVQGMVNSAKNLLPSVFGNLGKGFGDAVKIKAPKLPNLSINQDGLNKLRNILSGKALFDKISGLFNNPPFLKKLKEILSKVGGGFGGGGGSKGPITGISGSPIATGGLIPKGFPNDTFPARLTSGEMVVPPGDVPRLSKFLDRQERGSSSDAGLLEKIAAMIEARPITVALTLNEQQLATAVFNARRRGFRI